MAHATPFHQQRKPPVARTTALKPGRGVAMSERPHGVNPDSPVTGMR
jgi:hypothetical protein